MLIIKFLKDIARKVKKQKNNSGTAVSLIPKINSRRVISTILAVIFMVSMLTVTCFATGTGGTGGGTDMWTKATEIMKDVYNQVLLISTIAAVVTASIALLMMNFSKSGRTVDESRAWLKRIVITWAILNGLGFIMAYITPFFSDGKWNG